MLRKIVIVVVFLMVAYMIRILAGHYYAPVGKKPAEPATPAGPAQQMSYAVEALNGEMPMTVLDGALRIESAALKEGMLHFSATQVNKPDESNSDKQKFDQFVRESYCGGSLKSFAAAGIPLQYTFSSPPYSLDDLRVDTWTVALQPSDCR